MFTNIPDNISAETRGSGRTGGKTIQLDTIYTGDYLEVLKTQPICSGSGGLTLTVFWRTGHYTEDFRIDCP